jgi:DNA-binding transcriptional ArsR family regulator
MASPVSARSGTPASEFSEAGQASAEAAVDLSAFQAEVVGVFVGLGQAMGLPKSYGEIYGLLFASTQPLGFNEIQSRLGLSKGSVSQGLRALREIGAVVVAGDFPGRREGYVAATELRPLAAALLRGTLEPQLARGSARLKTAAGLLGAENLPLSDRRVLARRMDKLQGWHRKAGGLLPWIIKFLR